MSELIRTKLGQKESRNQTTQAGYATSHKHINNNNNNNNNSSSHSHNHSHNKDFSCVHSRSNHPLN